MCLRVSACVCVKKRKQTCVCVRVVPPLPLVLGCVRACLTGVTKTHNLIHLQICAPKTAPESVISKRNTLMKAQYRARLTLTVALQFQLRVT